MKRSVVTAEFTSSPQTVWAVVTDNRHTEWRSGVKAVQELKGGREFVEYSKGGFPTRFQVTKKVSCKCYEFNLENRRLQGFWSGRFYVLPNGGTRIELSENIQIKNRFLRAVLEHFQNLQKSQDTYVRDLKMRLGEDA